jgi:hypothetical protein
MRSLLITAAVVTVAMALTGCPNRQQQPLPAPRSSAVSGIVPNTTPHTAAPASGNARQPDSPDEISWFQGTLEEAFSRRPCTEDHPPFRY